MVTYYYFSTILPKNIVTNYLDAPWHRQHKIIFAESKGTITDGQHTILQSCPKDSGVRCQGRY